jgi:hypothetical protein
LTILLAAFLSLLSLDVFTEETSFWEEILALVIHLVPTYIVVIVLLIAWKWEWVGALAFIGLAIFYVVMSGGRQHWSAYAVISGTLVVIGVMFGVNWKFREEKNIN